MISLETVINHHRQSWDMKLRVSSSTENPSTGIFLPLKLTDRRDEIFSHTILSKINELIILKELLVNRKQFSSSKAKSRSSNIFVNMVTFDVPPSDFESSERHMDDDHGDKKQIYRITPHPSSKARGRNEDESDRSINDYVSNVPSVCFGRIRDREFCFMSLAALADLSHHAPLIVLLRLARTRWSYS